MAYDINELRTSDRFENKKILNSYVGEKKEKSYEKIRRQSTQVIAQCLSINGKRWRVSKKNLSERKVASL